MTTLLLLFGILSAAATFSALFRLRFVSVLVFPVMMTGWLTSEYPLFHLAWQAVATAGLVALGGLSETRGVVGLSLTLVSWAGLLVAHRIALQAVASSEAALVAALGPDYLDRLEPARRARLRTQLSPGLTRRPMRHDATGIEIVSDISYGEHPKRNLLDVYRPTHLDEPAPVILQIHGGAWIIGHKKEQAQPLLHQLARNGYVAVSINYRLGPKSRFPDPIIDVKRAIAWVRENISDYGGDPSTIILTGGSAGGHLAALAALTPGYRDWQPGFENVDTSVAACVPFYGPPDLRNLDGLRSRLTSMEPFLTRMVMPGKLIEDPELWGLFSPNTHVGEHAPPFFIIQGENDILVWTEEAREFVRRLRDVSLQPVVYWEVPGAQHAFDTFNSIRSAAAVDAVERFVGWVSAPLPAQREADK